MSSKTKASFSTTTDEEEWSNEHNKVRMLRVPKTLSSAEKKYLLAVDRGDLATVRRIIQLSQKGGGSVDINAVDSLGRGALLMAIEGENLAMVELLIVMGVKTEDALLHAIDKQFVEAVELLLEHEEIVHQEGEPYSWEKIDRDTATFTAEITPFMLAAHRNNYEILKLLLDRGAVLPVPHDIRCTCQECTFELREDSLRYSASRINSYKALASPSLIALMYADPLLTAFELSWELRRLAVSENEFRADYLVDLELCKHCQDFAVELITRTRTSHELCVILNYDPHIIHDEDDTYEYGLARLRLAIIYKQKEFVGHPWVQQLLATIWYKGLPGFRQKTTFWKCMEILRIVLTFPFYCFWYMLAPKSQSGKLMRKPFMKFLTHAASYLLFLLLLILVSQRVEEQLLHFLEKRIGDKENANVEQKERQRGNAPQYLEYLIAAYVFGFILEETRELLREGFFVYMNDMWKIIDFSRNFLYCFGAVFRIWAYVAQQREISIDPEKAFISRENWDDFDPQLIAEGLLAAANVVSALKLVHLSTINPHLGPLQISLSRMVYDIFKLFFFYTVVLFAFASGLNQLLWYFADLEKAKCYSLSDGNADWKNSADSCIRWRRFGNLFESSQSLFWASFGMIDLSDFELSGIKSYTRFWALLMFGIYQLINVIILLNLLIAMLTNTYTAVAEEADTEWKFARTKLWLSYFDESNTLPSPFNLVPTPKQIKRLLTRFVPILSKFGKSSKLRGARCAKLKEQAREYTAVMRALVWRYVSGLQKRAEENQVTEDDINEIKGEISAFRCDLFEVFRVNGMNVSSKPERPAALGRKTREWKRRLLKGFHVTSAAGDESTSTELNREENVRQESFEKIQIENENRPGSRSERFRRVARLALRNRDHICKSRKQLSQIGRSSSTESRESLNRAMNEAKKQVYDDGLPQSLPNIYKATEENQKIMMNSTRIQESPRTLSKKGTGSGNAGLVEYTDENTMIESTIEETGEDSENTTTCSTIIVNSNDDKTSDLSNISLGTQKKETRKLFTPSVESSSVPRSKVIKSASLSQLPSIEDIEIIYNPRNWL